MIHQFAFLHYPSVTVTALFLNSCINTAVGHTIEPTERFLINAGAMLPIWKNKRHQNIVFRSKLRFWPSTYIVDIRRPTD